MITPNRLTVLRMVIAFLSPALLIVNRSILIDVLVFVLFTVAVVTDWWDGYLARTRRMVTSTGALMDPIADKLLILGLMFAFSFIGLYAFEWLVAILVRELAVTIARLIYLNQGRVIPAEGAGKLKVGFQIGSIYATLVFLVIRDSNVFGTSYVALTIVFHGIHYLGIFLANFFTLVSGILFFKRLEEA